MKDDGLWSKSYLSRESFITIFLLILMVTVLSFVLYNMSFSEKAKARANDNILFKNCIEEIALLYCEGEELDYTWTIYGNRYREDIPYHIALPINFICENKRLYNERNRFKFSEEEIQSCIPISDEVRR